MNEEYETEAGTPWHLWVIGILALIWNGFGCYDYIMTMTRNEAYMDMGGLSEAQREFFYSMPQWVDAFWALGVWGALLGSILLLLRSRWAVAAFWVSVIGLVGTTAHNYLLSETDVNALFGTFYTVFSVVIWVITLFLLWYATQMRSRGVLR